ncbi:segregation/condensation protein A [Fictibacillus aquaticus]|uniref:Segregation and condensation protein A n=1 Tax=Fictibacillus aquaticus TaxID=2021314 RepID=A0A235FAQ6_9BACL|nr:segregation/condensation protein A [Fictibacillus aquaticus]OYD58406.1 segregation/condensation protein A [Fictibacillus aquaticus]
MIYNVKLDGFEGPLDLLLHLIQTYEIDIYDIPVAIITGQYMNYIHTMKELKLDVASEYLVMAATLLAIKSKMLLPKHENDDFDQQMELEMEEDPREDLVRRLVEYKKYKHAAAELKEKEAERSLVYARQPMDLSSFEKEQETGLITNVSLYDMLSAFQKISQKKKEKRTASAKIERQEIPIEKRMIQIREKLWEKGGSHRFTDLFTAGSKDHLVVTFLALLELMKVKAVACVQEGNFGEIMIKALEEEKAV